MIIIIVINNNNNNNIYIYINIIYIYNVTTILVSHFSILLELSPASLFSPMAGRPAAWPWETLWF